MCNSGDCKFEFDTDEGDTRCRLPKGEICPLDLDEDETDEYEQDFDEEEGNETN